MQPLGKDIRKEIYHVRQQTMKNDFQGFKVFFYHVIQGGQFCWRNTVIVNSQ